MRRFDCFVVAPPSGIRPLYEGCVQSTDALKRISEEFRVISAFVGLNGIRHYNEQYEQCPVLGGLKFSVKGMLSRDVSEQ